MTTTTGYLQAPGSWLRLGWHTAEVPFPSFSFLPLFLRIGTEPLQRRVCNIPSAPAYGVYACQLVRYARCCSSYSDLVIRHRALVKRLLSQGYTVNGLSNTFKKFYGRHTDLVGQYKKNVCQMFPDSIS